MCRVCSSGDSIAHPGNKPLIDIIPPCEGRPILCLWVAFSVKDLHVARYIGFDQQVTTAPSKQHSTGFSGCISQTAIQLIFLNAVSHHFLERFLSHPPTASFSVDARTRAFRSRLICNSIQFSSRRNPPHSGRRHAGEQVCLLARCNRDSQIGC